MIKITRLNKAQCFINAEMIEQVESTPDTVISLANGKTILVLESPQEVVKRIIRYKRRIFRQPLGPGKNQQDTG